MEKKDVGEADRIFSILTKDFGRIDAMAQGVRYIKSKLRYNLDDFSYSRIGLTMSGELWRIIDAEELGAWVDIRSNPKKLTVVFRIADLLNRMVRGQEPDASLWEEVKNSLVFLEKYNMEDEKSLITFELLTNLKILSHLGYVADHEKWLNLSLEKAQNLEPMMTSAIKTAIQESQL